MCHDAGAIPAIGMRYHEQIAFTRMAEGEEAVLFLGVIGVGMSDGKWITKDRRRLLEGLDIRANRSLRV